MRTVWLCRSGVAYDGDQVVAVKGREACARKWLADQRAVWEASPVRGWTITQHDHGTHVGIHRGDEFCIIEEWTVDR